jgi:hypothetical protein
MSKLNFAESAGPDDAGALDQSKLAGLCLTCNHAQTCVRAKHSGQPVWFCEEFDDYIPQSSQVAGTGWKVIDEDSELQSRDHDRARTFGGICVNCTTRETCTLSGSGIDIWECNEYS